MKTPVIGIAGWSGSGKTTLLEYVLPCLAVQGLRVNVIKHTHHVPALDAADKDSSRLHAAGAADVLLAASCDGEQPDLNSLLLRQQPADLTVVEGFKNAPIPKLEIYRADLGEPPLYLYDTNVIAVATDVPPPSVLRRRLIWLDIHQPAQVLSWLQMYIGMQIRSVPQIVLL